MPSFLIGGTRWIAACRTFYYTTLLQFCQVIFSKKVAQIFIPNFVQFDYCNFLLCMIYLYYQKRDREPKVKAVEKISKKFKKVLTNKTAYDIINT